MKHIAVMLAQRLGIGLFSLLVVSLFIALGVELLPGDLAEEILGQAATPETVAAFRRELGLDLPAHTRYFAWLGDLLSGDFGRSLANDREIAELLGSRIFNTLFLAGFAAAISVPLALTLGVLAALYRNTAFDRTINATTLTSISFPDFFVAYVLILFLAIQAGALSRASPRSMRTPPSRIACIARCCPR